MKTFSVGWIFQAFAAQQGLNLTTENIDDVCFGFAVSSDKTFAQVLRENSGPYNFQVVDGDPIRLVRRAVNSDLVIDVSLNEVDLIRRNEQPAIAFQRVEPSTLPRQIEISYIDPDRNYATNTQVARHTAAPITNTQMSVPLSFVITAQQARDMAYDMLYRYWSQQLSLIFETTNLQIEPGDVVQITSTQGVYTCIVVSQTLNMPSRTNTVQATILLTEKGVSDIATAPTADSYISNIDDEWAPIVTTTI